jgi:hypothetical protein
MPTVWLGQLGKQCLSLLPMPFLACPDDLPCLRLFWVAAVQIRPLWRHYFQVRLHSTPHLMHGPTAASSWRLAAACLGMRLRQRCRQRSSKMCSAPICSAPTLLRFCSAPTCPPLLQNTQGLIFVVDSNDRDRIGEARDELHRMLNEVRDWSKQKLPGTAGRFGSSPAESQGSSGP